MPESQNIEWKESWSDSCLKTISAFANAFFLAGYIESWGSGIDRMIMECRSAKVPDPVFRSETGGIWVEFPFSKQKTGVVSTPKTTPKNLSGKTSGKTREETRLDEKLDEKLDERLGKNRAEIIRLMSANPKITVTEMAKSLGMSRTAADKNIQVLKAQEWIRRIGPAKGGHWEVLK